MGGFILIYQGWLPVKFIFGRKTTKQALYICEKIQVLYFSEAACIHVGILHEDFLNTVATVSTQATIAMQYILSTGTHEKLGPNSNDSIYWPGINVSIRNVRVNCIVCLNITTRANQT